MYKYKSEQISITDFGQPMIVDATCAPSQIQYPQDANLLNQARKSTEQLIDKLHTPGEN